MYWIIGDIHGMLDPLKILVKEMERRHFLHLTNPEKYPDHKIEKIIFIGDYIDYGPSSKEVIDYILDLTYEKVFLAGNHEDFLLQFIKNSSYFKNYGNVWFRGGGGQVTVNSFMKNIFHDPSDHNIEFSPKDFKLSKKHLNFFSSLVYSHRETISGVDFIFVHAGLESGMDIEKQLALKSYKEFHKYLEKNKIWIENSIIWTRKEPKNKFGKSVIVHGHSPTFNLNHQYGNLHGYDLDSHYPFCKFEEDEEYRAEYQKGYSDWDLNPWKYENLSRLISINIDTGAIYGKKLTALGIPTNMKKLNKMEVLQVSTGNGYRELTSQIRHHRLEILPE